MVFCRNVLIRASRVSDFRERARSTAEKWDVRVLWISAMVESRALRVSSLEKKDWIGSGLIEISVAMAIETPESVFSSSKCPIFVHYDIIRYQSIVIKTYFKERKG